MRKPSVALCVILGVILGFDAARSWAHDFGDNPLDTVINQAGDANKCTGLTTNELAAMVLAPTWGRVGLVQAALHRR